MKRKKPSIKYAITLFATLSVIFTVGSLSLMIKLPDEIATMKEIKASVIELEELKVVQTEEQDKLVNEINEINTEIKSMQETLDKMKEQGLKVEENNEEQPVKYAYLTFDDGPSENTIKILDFLKENNIKATFFVIGKEGYDDVYKRIVDEGHTLAVHSNTHIYSEIYISVYAFRMDINTLAARLEKLTGTKPTIMRFPGGSNNTVSYKYGGEELMNKLIKAVQEDGFTYYDWNVDSSDASGNDRSKDAIFNAVMNGVKGKENAIILMHDAAAKKTTVDALPQIVAGLRKKGFVLDAITEETPLVQFKK